jgi:hypothetical protein
MKKFTVTCSFGNQTGNITVYIGQPEATHHPIHFQSEWLTKEKGGVIPKQIMESLAKLHEISLRNNVPFEELCEYALEASKYEVDNNSVADGGAKQPSEGESQSIQIDTVDAEK